MNSAPIVNESEQTSLSAELVRVDTLLAQQSLYDFIVAAWPIIEPGKQFQPNWHLEVICDQLERVTRREIKRLIINVPPRSTKSTIVSVLWPVWTWIQDATHQWLTVSHGADLAIRDALKSRRLLQSPWFQSRWGNLFKLTGDQNQKSRYENDKRGYRIALGMTAGVTGEGADTLVIDDPHSRDSAHSELERNTALTTFDETLSTRLNNPSTGAIVVIMQRLHTLDLTGHLLAKGGWKHIRFPMEYEANNPDPLDKRTREGEPLWPERFTPDVIAAMKLNLGSYGYAGQAQQRPNPKGGGIWRTGWFKQWRALPANLTNYTQSWDFAAKDTKDGSYNVGQVWAENGPDKYLLDQVRFRGGMNDALTMFKALCNKWPQCRAKLIEDKANGSPILNMLEQEIGGLIATNPGVRGKAERAQAVAPFIEAGNVWIPAESNWLSDFLSEIEAFPNGAHDDQVDTASQALERLCVPVGTGGFELMQDAFAEIDSL